MAPPAPLQEIERIRDARLLAAQTDTERTDIREAAELLVERLHDAMDREAGQ